MGTTPSVAGVLVLLVSEDILWFVCFGVTVMLQNEFWTDQMPSTFAKYCITPVVTFVRELWVEIIRIVDTSS